MPARNLNYSVGGKRILGTPKTGVLGSLIPSTGDSGAGFLYNDLSLPADDSKEIRGEIIDWPSSGVLVAYEDSSFSFTGAPDDTYSFTYQLYVDGVLTGSVVTVTLQVGPVTHSATGAIVASSATVTGVAVRTPGSSGGGTTLSQADIDAIAAAVLSLLMANTIPVDMKKTNGVNIIGDGTPANKFRATGV